MSDVWRYPVNLERPVGDSQDLVTDGYKRCPTSEGPPTLTQVGLTHPSTPRLTGRKDGDPRRVALGEPSDVGEVVTDPGRPVVDGSVPVPWTGENPWGRKGSWNEGGGRGEDLVSGPNL